ncbi:MAG: hypothetical protein Q4C97_08460 [Bacillota bacterium]|nr:hypothetical protein [Bacillota bacterium]
MKKRKGLLAMVFLLSLALTGCQIVEPEKRAYPLVVGLDWQEGRYQVYLGMAQLASSTGQGKEGGEEQQGTGTGALLLEGDSQEAIQKLYDSTRELYLDPGHIQSVIFGKGLLENPERLSGVLERMETNTSMGNSAYVFAAEDVGAVFGENGTAVESLGQFLSGIYENRTQYEKPVTLAGIYRDRHNQGTIPELPRIRVQEEQIYVDK